MSQEKEETEMSSPAPVNSQPVYVGDPVDKATIRQLARRGLIPYVLMFLLIAGNVIQYLRSPEVLVIRESAQGERVVLASSRMYRLSGDITFGPDAPGETEKITLVKIFTENLYGIDPKAREYQLKKAHGLLVSDFAAKYFTDYKASGLLDKQRDELWQAKWETQKVEVDRRDPYLVHVIGTQDITKHVGDKTDREVVQHALDFKLVDDGSRTLRNNLSGFLIARFSGSEISRNRPASTDSEIQLPQ